MNQLFAKLIFPFLVTITLSLWVLSKPSLQVLTAAPFVSIAQILGLAGITSLAWNFVLASRFKVIDKLYGGLDKVFKHHRRTGELAFIFMLAHPFFLILQAFPNQQIAKLYTIPGPIWTYNWGIFALWGFIILISLTLVSKLPYHIWKITHRFMGVPFAFVVLHVATVDSDIAFYMPLRYWILGITFTSLGLYIYKVFLYKYLGPRYKYTVKNVSNKEDVTELILTPINKRLPFYPGQFVFVSLRDNRVGKEEHPFSISSAPHKENLRLSIKSSGDHTERMKGVETDSIVWVYGPYGQFAERFISSKKKSLWIAGGIGVTPFLSMLHSLQETDPARDIRFIFGARNKKAAIYHEEIEGVVAELPHTTLHFHESDTEGHLTTDIITEECPDYKDRLIFICGPAPMMHAMAREFKKIGVPRKNIIFEDFSFRYQRPNLLKRLLSRKK